jgi:hypothetical protein
VRFRCAAVGKGCQAFASNYATDNRHKGDAAGFRKWHSVERIIEMMQSAEDSCADTVCGVRRSVAIDRRAGWVKGMAREGRWPCSGWEAPQSLGGPVTKRPEHAKHLRQGGHSAMPRPERARDFLYF